MRFFSVWSVMWRRRREKERVLFKKSKEKGKRRRGVGEGKVEAAWNWPWEYRGQEHTFCYRKTNQFKACVSRPLLFTLSILISLLLSFFVPVFPAGFPQKRWRRRIRNMRNTLFFFVRFWCCVCALVSAQSLLLVVNYFIYIHTYILQLPFLELSNARNLILPRARVLSLYYSKDLLCLRARFCFCFRYVFII
ncbi:hypothetical protein DFH27DRAFT_22811 [Peziza echinospora]|nr:hypothetical protein DFH27DRAFT_22811 [Peziza echinospora]